MDKIKEPNLKTNFSQPINTAKKVATEVTNVTQPIVESYDLSGNKNNEVDTEIVEVVPDTYQNVIVSTQEELGNSDNLEQLSSAFTTLLGENGISKIASSAEAAANGNFIESANIQASYWTDKPLKFELQENGSYLILQLNEDGNYTAMGYTTAESATEYLNGLRNIVDSNENQTLDTDNSDQPSFNKTDTYYITSNQLNDTVRKEIMEYADADIMDKGNKEEIYNTMSEQAKAIIDGKIKVLTPTENLKEIVDREMDIVIPENARVKIGDDYIIGIEGKTLKYDQEDNVYKVEGNNSRIGGAKYSKVEMLTLEITETRG